MPNKTTILFLVASACIIAGSVWYQKIISLRILENERVLLSEDRAYFKQVDRTREAVTAEIKSRYAFTDSFSFIFPLFAIFDTINPCTNRPSEIKTLVDRILENTALSQIKKKEYSSSLEVFEEAFNLILSTIDSTQLTQKAKEVPVLMVEEYSSSKDSCVVKMYPISSWLIPDSVLIYKNDELLIIDSLPFLYEGNTIGMRIKTKNGRRYGEW